MVLFGHYPNSFRPPPPLSNGQTWNKVLQTILASLYTPTPLYTFQEGASLSLVVDSLIAPQPHLLPLQFESVHGASHNLQVTHVGGQLPHHSLFHLLPVAAIQLKLPRSHICVESGFLPIEKQSRHLEPSALYQRWLSHKVVLLLKSSCHIAREGTLGQN